jgi:hypothetical protein
MTLGCRPHWQIWSPFTQQTFVCKIDTAEQAAADEVTVSLTDMSPPSAWLYTNQDIKDFPNNYWFQPYCNTYAVMKACG